MRAFGPRQVQISVPDPNAAGFIVECRRQCLLIAAGSEEQSYPLEMRFWEDASADAWDDLD